MRKVIVVLWMLLAATSVTADDGARDKNCRNAYQFASKIMEARQAGVPVVDMMDVAAEQDDERVSKVARSFTLKAYERPRFNTRKSQQKEIARFANSAYLACMR